MKVKTIDDLKEVVTDAAAERLTNALYLSLHIGRGLFQMEVSSLAKAVTHVSYAPPTKEAFDQFVSEFQQRVRKERGEGKETLKFKEMKTVMKNALTAFMEWLVDQVKQRKEEQQEVYT